jgi:hypothetical protein
MSTRAEQRRLRQLEIEKEQLIEDDEALKMTEEQHETLLRSFQSVKFEFHDLDGLSWTDSIRQKLQQDTPSNVSQPSIVEFSKAELPSFSPEETIRVSATRLPVSQEDVEECFQSHDNFSTPALRRGKRDGTRTRSPVKGLFSACGANNRESRHASEDFGMANDQDTIKMRESPVSGYSVKDNSFSVSPRPSMDAGIIKSIFRSPVFSPNRGRMRSQTCSVVSTPKSSPSLASICTFASP